MSMFAFRRLREQEAAARVTAASISTPPFQRETATESPDPAPTPKPRRPRKEPPNGTE